MDVVCFIWDQCFLGLRIGEYQYIPYLITTLLLIMREPLLLCNEVSSDCNLVVSIIIISSSSNLIRMSSTMLDCLLHVVTYISPIRISRIFAYFREIYLCSYVAVNIRIQNLYMVLLKGNLIHKVCISITSSIEFLTTSFTVPIIYNYKHPQNDM